jgi:hypothetical protein
VTAFLESQGVSSETPFWFLRGVHNHFWSGLACFKLCAHFLNLRGLLFELGRESLYLFLLLRDRGLQLLNFVIEHGLLGVLRNVGLGGEGGKSTRVGSSDRGRAQPPIGIDEHDGCRPHGNRRAEDVIDKAPVTYLAKNTVDTIVVADDDIVIGEGDTTPSVVTHAHVRATRGLKERIITDGCVKGARSSSQGPITYRIILAADLIGEKRCVAVRVVEVASGVFIERSITNSVVVDTVSVEIERRITMSTVAAGGAVCQRISAGGNVKESRHVGKKRINASSGVVAAAGIVSERSKTSRRVLLTGRVLIECLESSAGVPDPSGEVDQDANTFAIVAGRYVAIRVGTDRVHHRCKPKTDNQKWN